MLRKGGDPKKGVDYKREGSVITFPIISLLRFEIDVTDICVQKSIQLGNLKVKN